jgi:hypothetical protein
MSRDPAEQKRGAYSIALFKVRGGGGFPLALQSAHQRLTQLSLKLCTTLPHVSQQMVVQLQQLAAGISAAQRTAQSLQQGCGHVSFSSGVRRYCKVETFLDTDVDYLYFCDTDGARVQLYGRCVFNLYRCHGLIWIL